MPAHSAAFVMPSSIEEDFFSDSTQEVAGGLTAKSRKVLGQTLHGVPHKKLGLAVLVLATVGAACAFVTGSLPHNVASGEAGEVTGLHEEKGKEKGSSKKHSKKKEESDDDGGKCGKPFAKCGGTDFTGKTCCQRGCACIKRDEYFSMCEAPEGLDTCDLKEARKQSAKLRAKLAPQLAKLKMKVQKYKANQKRADKLQKAFVQARALASEALKKSQAAKAKMDDQNKTYMTAVNKSHHVGWQKDLAVKWWTTVDNEKNEDCGDWNGECQESKCCQHGCGCVYKNPYYSQCGPPKGQKDCSVAIAKATATKHAIAATGSKSKSSAEDAKKAAKDAGTEVYKQKEVLKKLVAEHEKLHEEYMKSHKDRVQAEDLRDSSKKAAEVAKKRVKNVKKKMKKDKIAAKVWDVAVRDPVAV